MTMHRNDPTELHHLIVVKTLQAELGGVRYGLTKQPTNPRLLRKEASLRARITAEFDLLAHHLISAE